MIVFRIPCFLAFLLLVNCCVAQNRSYNTIFDTLVVHDTTAPLIEYTGLWPGAQKQGGDILQQLLNDTEHTEEEKFWYLHNASCDTARHLPKHIADTINIWKRSLATRIVEGYFYRDWDSDGDAWYAIVNAVPIDSKILEDYINNLPTLKEKKRHEERVCYWLVQSGKEEKALHLLKRRVADYVAGIEQHNISSLFTSLCFSKNNAFHREAMKLLWTCLEYKYNYRLLELGLYIDEAAAIKYLQKWFWYYASQKLPPAPPPQPKDDWKGEFRVIPPALTSLVNIIQVHAPCLSKALGKQFWVEFEARMPYWDAYVSLNILFQLPVLESIFANTSLTKEEKQQMLLAVTNKDYPGSNSRLRYLQLVKQAWPNGNIPEYEFIQLNLCNIITWQTPVTYPVYMPRIFDVDTVVADIKRSGIADLQLNTDFWKYNCSLFGFAGRFNDNFNDVFKQTGLIRDVCLSCYDSPASYKKLFNAQFEALLVKTGVRDIQVHEEITESKEGHLYKLYVRSNEAACKMEFETEEHGPFFPQRLVKMINLLLMKKGVKERFIELEYQYDGLEFGLFEPDKIKPLLDKYNVRCYVVGNKYKWDTVGKVELKR